MDLCSVRPSGSAEFTGGHTRDSWREKELEENLLTDEDEFQAADR